jgi:aerobic-type carbon monoxide dehydrogenase small subunit (CoxS/CutS family)
MSDSKKGRDDDFRCQRPNGKQVHFTLDGEEHIAYQGDTIASALLAVGRKSLRRTPRRNEPRGLFCGIGICHECLIQVDERPNVRACLTRIFHRKECTTAGKRANLLV